jgi:N-acylneuraminate cytidylyltransferase/CMP-N,N'-diacetyllegionaminic acid synthase
VPARAGSKGIPGKNIAPLGGHPLIWYTLRLADALVDRGLADHAVISSDIDELQGIAAEFPHVELPFVRPAELANDCAKTIDVVIHALDWLERERGIAFQSLLLLQATTPLRYLADVEQALELWERHPEADSLISVYREETITPAIMYRRDEDFAVPLASEHNAGRRRQEEASLYVRNGAIYLARTDFIRAQGRLFGEQPLLLEMPKGRSVNIDSPEDLEFLRWKISQ